MTKSLKSFLQLKAILPAPVHLERMNGRIDQNVTYCTKDGTGIVKLGDIPMSRSEQSAQGRKGAEHGSKGGPHGAKAPDRWKMLQEACAEGHELKELTARFPDLFGQYHKGFMATYDLHKPVQTYDLRKVFTKLFDWEEKLLQLITTGPDKRSVHWIWSEHGAMGKSEMVKHLVGTLEFQPLQNAPTRDLACAWKGGNVVIDIARSDDTTNYQFIENAKNGLVFSSKYESTCKMSKDFKPVFVICFANAPPELKKLSLDRWMIYRINADKTWTKQRIVSDMLVDEIEPSEGWIDIGGEPGHHLACGDAYGTARTLISQEQALTDTLSSQGSKLLNSTPP